MGEINDTMMDMDEMFLNFVNTTNDSVVYWLDDNLTNMSYPLDNNTAIVMERNLQTVGNYLVLSLAVADLMVACLVMPMGALYEVNQQWILGPELCEIWTSGDVLCCTASILHLLAIALDRYWAVTNVDYVRQRSGNRVGLMIFMVWAVGFMVSLAPVFGWKDDDFLYRIQEEKKTALRFDNDLVDQIISNGISSEVNPDYFGEKDYGLNHS
ncbi:5-hydroxytryptamine receptor 2A [Caerostris extrusa]|uniref:5-hydroxytryptamine receptor 2A n=1 Tax=Caerostris extrusa TaxID=172846 RepID=A0AAV4YE07_CAEEX|nr:5-hydroxytryptamine receptor 2A [Caerostris extrusa]